MLSQRLKPKQKVRRSAILSKKYPEEKQCEGKVRYTFAQAKRNSRKLRRDKGDEFNEYYCEYCGWYHVGHA